MSKISSSAGNLTLLIASTSLCFLILEIACRVFPWAGYDEHQINNPYHYIERIGRVPAFSPHSTYAERVPLRFDHHSYYARTKGLVSFYTNQFGARWMAPADQPLAESRILVLGDSFTYGHGLHYEDTYVFRLQQKFEEKSIRLSFINFAKRGADAEEVLAIYRRFNDTVPHNAVLYGLHLNDLLRFPTGYVITNPLALPWLVERSKAVDFIVKRIHRRFIRQYCLAYLTDSVRLTETHFSRKLRALVTLNEEAHSHGVRLYVAVLPILVDLNRETFAPLYAGIRQALDAHRVEYIDLTACLNDFADREVWILPFDQHPNHVANEIFADRLFDEFRHRGIPATPAGKNETGEKQQAGAAREESLGYPRIYFHQ